MTFNILKLTIIAILPLILGGCILASKEETPFISPNEEAIIKSILTENGISISNRLYDHLDIEYQEYPYHYDEESYKITLYDTTYDRIVLSDKINLLRNYENYKGIVARCQNDSVGIITDSFICIYSLNIEHSGLTHLPQSIGDIRALELNIGWNNMSSIPIEILKMDSLPQPYDSLSISIYGSQQWYNQETYDTLPQWARDFLEQH